MDIIGHLLKNSGRLYMSTLHLFFNDSLDSFEASLRNLHGLRPSQIPDRLPARKMFWVFKSRCLGIFPRPQGSPPPNKHHIDSSWLKQPFFEKKYDLKSNWIHLPQIIFGMKITHNLKAPASGCF